MPVDIYSQEWESLVVGLGGKMGQAPTRRRGGLVPRARFEYLHQFEDEAPEITGHFVNNAQGNTFVIRTNDPDRDYFNLQLTVSDQFAQGRSTYVYFEQVLGNSQFDCNDVTAGVRLEF